MHRRRLAKPATGHRTRSRVARVTYRVPNNRSFRRSGIRDALILLVGVALVVAVLFGRSIAHRRAEATDSQGLAGTSSGSVLADPSTPFLSIGSTVPRSLYDALSTIPAAAFNHVDANGATPPTAVGTAANTSTAKADVLFVGAESCPYCAAERWPIVVALARFGTWHGLLLTQSASGDVDPNTPTFSFRSASFESRYISLQTVEVQGRTPDSSGHYLPLQTPSVTEAKLIQTDDAPPYVAASNSGAVPFLLIGRRYMWSGASYSPSLFQTYPSNDWKNIANSLAKADTGLSRSILANANMISASICRDDGGRPAGVCSSSGVSEAAKRLPR